MLKLSKAALILCCFCIFLTGVFYYPKWKQKGTEATISWDASGYYMYLPAAFIYKDLKQCRFQQSIMEKYGPTPAFEQAYRHESSNYVMKYSCGQALILSPFFFIGHAIARSSKTYPADGFSFPYQISIGLGMLLIAVLGIILLRKILIEFFSDGAVALTIISVTLGSNYFNYAAIDGAMTHNTLFTLYATLVYTTISFYKKPEFWKSILIGALIGIATLTRPTEIISALIPFLWGIRRFAQIKKRFSFFFIENKYGIAMTATAFLIISIQFIYWKSMTGQWLVYSYQNEKFSFLRPHFKECFVGYRSGWLVYSPIMILSIIGFFALYKLKRELFFPIAIFCFLFTYICFSWDIWWYGGSLGQRAMIQSYPLLAFPMASFFSWLPKPVNIWRILTLTFVGFCIWFNLWLTHQGHWGGLLRVGEMTRAYYWAIFGRSKVDERVQSLLDNSSLYDGNPQKFEIIYSNNFDNDGSPNSVAIEGTPGKLIQLTDSLQFSSEYFFKVNNKNKKWIRASADFTSFEKEWESWKMTQFIMKFYNGSSLIQTKQIRVFRMLGDYENKNLLLDVKMPKKPFDRVSILFWNSGSNKKILIDNLKVISF